MKTQISSKMRTMSVNVSAMPRGHRGWPCQLVIFVSCLFFLGLSEAVLFNEKKNIFEPSEIVITPEDLHTRIRRDAAAAPAVAVTTNAPSLPAISPMSNYVHLNNSHLHLMVHWAGQGSPVVFCLGRDQEMKPGAKSQVFRSKDYGLTFEDISDKLKTEAGVQAVINKFYYHSKSFCRYVFTDTVNRYIFMSDDCGETFTAHKLDTIVPSAVEFDERRDRVFLIHDLESPEKRLYVTKNFGETLSPVQDYVKSFFLKYLPTETELFIQRLEPLADGSADLSRTTILSSKNFFEKQIDTRVIYVGAKEFQIMGDYLFVTRLSFDEKLNTSGLDLLISMHGERFVQAKFDDTNLTNVDYHVVDVTEDGEIVLVVNHNAILSNLYTSTRITPYEVTFTLSLERVMYYSPNVTWHDSWLAATAGEKPFADVYKVQGLRGIYIASQINHDAWASLHSGKASTSIEPKDLVSLITYNTGSIWSPIRGPSRDEEGRPIMDCAVLSGGGGDCALHLAQQLSKKFPSTRSIPILSSASAVGVIIGTGNVGKGLRQRSNVFLSADAGVSWHQVLKGSHYFSMGDHGGIVVAVKYFKTEGSTNELLYSTNEGITWEKLIFYTEPLRVFGLLTEPGENSTVFTIFGTAGGPASLNWILVRVDLRSVFERNCTEDDYKRWSPADNTVGKHRSCLLGRKEIYERRVVNARCFNGRDRDRLKTVENCVCDRNDYQCDFGYHRDDDWTGACIRNPLFDSHDFYLPPANCPPGSFYNQSRGYLKIRGDSCVGGKDNIYEAMRVACPVQEEKEFILVAQRPSILRIDLRNLSHVDTLPLTMIQNVIALEFDMQENCVIYGDIEMDKIIMQCLNGSAPKVLVENNLSVEGMSLDWIGKVLYFVDGQKRTIEAVRTNADYAGRMRKTILNEKVLGKPRGIVVHPIKGYLFYSDWHEGNPHIGRANMDGDMHKIVVKKEWVQWPNGLSIDPLANRLYWVDAQKDYIGSCDLDGNGFKQVLQSSQKLVHPFAVTIHKENVYYDDWEKKAIYRADKNSGKGIFKVKADLAGAMDMKAFDRLHQPAYNNSCTENPCSHLCVPTPNGYSCLCPDGLKSKPRPDGSVVCMCADNKTVAYPNGTCPATIAGANGVGFVCDEKTQFSCENKLCVPKQWRCDGDDDCGDNSDEKGCGRPGGVNGSECRPSQFSCANGEKCIPDVWRCDFDNDCSDGSDEVGCNKTVCGADFFQCTNGQCISSKWRCDLEKDCQDGTDEENCTVIAPECKSDEFQCGNSGQCLPQTWKCDGESDCPGGEDEKECSSNNCQDWQFKCNDGQCIFSTWQCDGDHDCVDGSDEANCTDFEDTTVLKDPAMPTPVFPKGSDCNEWMFKCHNDQCIPYWWKCDGSPDCSDSSDELECGPISGKPSYTPNNNNDNDGTNSMTGHGTYSSHCGPTKFECGSGECIWQAWVCDGQADCDNGEDETTEMCAGFPPPCDPARQFRCEQSGQCISYEQICDNHQDCTDNTDELGCDPTEPETSSQNPRGCTGPGLFSCDFGQCFPESAMCDGHLDCFDGTDEPSSCPPPQFPVPKIRGLSPVDRGITSRSVRVDWLLSDISGASRIEYQPGYKLDGNNDWKDLDWVKLPETTYTFTGLLPYKSYIFRIKLRTRNQGEGVDDAFSHVQAMTSPDVPSPPTIVDVRQVGDNVQINWTAPSQPNGELTKYIIHVKEDATSSSWITNSASETTFKIATLRPDASYVFTVQAANTHFVGNESAPFTFTFRLQNKKAVEQLSLVGTPAETNITLKWKQTDVSLTNVEYRVSTKSDNQIAKHGDVVVKGEPLANNFIGTTITGLSPNTSYSFSVSVIVDGLQGPQVTILARTSGRSLPKPRITDAQVTPESGTSIKLTWKLPEGEKNRTGWVYGIYYGLNNDDMILHGCRNTTESDSFTVKHLDACESYSFVVAIVDPKGFGPPSGVFTKLTKYSPGAPPKNLRAELEPVNKSSIILTWNASCSTVDTIGYLISIEDQVTGEKSQISLARQSATFFRRELKNNVRFGTTYRFSVKTDDPNSVEASTTISTLPIPAPEMLNSHMDLNSSTHVIFWKVPETKLLGYLRDDFRSNKVSFRIYLTTHANITSAEKIFNVTTSQSTFDLPMSELEGGRIYFLFVTMVDKDGYESEPASPIAIESPIPSKSIVVSPTNVAGVLVPVILVIVILGAALGYYMHRNRRLTRSFQEFTSRYSPASGSASILNQNTLDDDDDDYSPIIRGFSDHEPLVVS